MSSLIDNYAAWISIGVTALLTISEILPFLRSHDYNGILHYFAVLAERIRIKRAAEKAAAAAAAAAASTTDAPVEEASSSSSDSSAKSASDMVIQLE